MSRPHEGLLARRKLRDWFEHGNLSEIIDLDRFTGFVEKFFDFLLKLCVDRLNLLDLALAGLAAVSNLFSPVLFRFIEHLEHLHTLSFKRSHELVLSANQAAINILIRVRIL